MARRPEVLPNCALAFPRRVVASGRGCAGLLLLGTLLVGCAHSGSVPAPSDTGPPKSPFGIEVIVRTGENFHSAADVVAFVATAAQTGVVAINLLVKQDEDAALRSGQVFYASAIAPPAPGFGAFDALQAVLDAAHARNIKVRAWVPQFHDQVAARANPAWQMMALSNDQTVPYSGARQQEYFVNPLHPQVQAYEQSILVELAARYPIDGFMLDWLRFDNFNMDLSDYTRRAYQALYGIDPATIDFATANGPRDQWNTYRSDGIAAYVRATRRQLPPRYSLGVYILPPEFIEVAQDAAKFNSDVGSLAPMCYFLDWGYALDWLWSSCLRNSAQKAGAAEIVPAMDAKLSDAQYQQIFTHLRADFPQIHTIAWFYHGTWTASLLRQLADRSRL